MSSVKFSEILDLLKKKGCETAFVEIDFQSDRLNGDAVDHELANRTITAESNFGSVVISFDERGCLKTIDIS